MEAPVSHPLSLLVKPASADCNLACRYCFYLSKAELYPETKVHRMSDEVLERMIQEYLAFQPQMASFVWQGGEPTLMGLDFYRRAVELQAKHGQRGQVVANGLQTNGLVLDAEWCEFLREYNFLVGLSLDGPPHVHDHYRRSAAGKGSFERVMGALRPLRESGTEFNLLVMATPVSAPRGRELYDFFRSHNLDFLQFIPCVERDPATGGIADYSVTPQGYGQLLCDVFDCWAEDDWRGTYIRMFNDLLAVYSGQQMPTCIFRDRCGDYVVVEYNGDVYACDFFVEPEWRLGNIMEQPLAEIVASDKFAQFADRKSDYGAPCRSCEWLHLCHGGCPKYRLVSYDDHRAPTYLCAAYRQLFAHADERLRAMARELESERMSARHQPRAQAAAIGRNDPCPCGSGRKYKRCCMR
ncbi:MAG: anaerobic sulfatase maturase [Armatimonadota bacterium]